LEFALKLFSVPRATAYTCSLCYSALCYRPSVCLSVTRVDQSKAAIEVRIMQLLLQSSPMTLSFLTVNFTAKFQRLQGAGRRMTEG